MLDNLVAYQCTSPCRLTVGTYVDVLVEDGSALTLRTPTPDETVGTIGSSLTGIESTAVEHTFLAILRPVGTGIVEASLQILVGLCHHILHLAAPIGTIGLAVNEIPVVAHLKDVGALTHAVPNHIELTGELPVLHVA